MDKKNEIARKIARKEQGERKRIEMGSDYVSSEGKHHDSEDPSDESSDLEEYLEVYGS